jgi:hypothetical protein
MKLLILVMPACLVMHLAFASEQVGTLTQVDGAVKLFTHPGKSVQGPAPHALFENEYYSVRDAKMGDRVEKGNILRTAPGAKARVVYDNGDQFNVGSGTAYRIFWDKDASVTKTNVNLMYGKLRGIVEKGGPRGRLTVRTRSATMGVRGTDFFIAEGGEDGGTEVSILRGKVEVKAETKEAKPVEVKAGYSAEIPAPPPVVKTPETKPAETKAEEKKVAEHPKEAPKPAPVVELRQTTKEDLVAIQKSSAIKIEPKKEIAAVEKTEVTEKVKKLEEKAVQTTLKDIKQADPQLYAKLQTAPIKSTEELNAQAVHTLMQTAPKAPEKRKPYKSELEDLESGAYEKYFKVLSD